MYTKYCNTNPQMTHEGSLCHEKYNWKIYFIWIVLQFLTLKISETFRKQTNSTKTTGQVFQKRTHDPLIFHTKPTYEATPTNTLHVGLILQSPQNCLLLAQTSKYALNPREIHSQERIATACVFLSVAMVRKYLSIL